MKNYLFYETISCKIYITIKYNPTKKTQIENLDYSKYNCQSLDLTCDKICVGNGIFFNFNNDGKLDICYILKIRYPVIKNN